MNSLMHKIATFMHARKLKISQKNYLVEIDIACQIYKASDYFL